MSFIDLLFIYNTITHLFHEFNSYLLLTLKCKVSLLVDISRENFLYSQLKRSRNTLAGNEPTVLAIVMNC